MNVAVVVGSRPEIIKMSPLIRELSQRGISHFILHTGQHYDYLMNKIFFEELGIHSEMINLAVGSGKHGEITGKMMIGIEQVLLDRKPDAVLVQGDTNTVLAASLVSVKLHIPLGHIESGLRSYDRRMPEEYNRVIADHIADYLYLPTHQAQQTVHKEGLDHAIVTGNTIVDAVQQTLEIARQKSSILKTLNLQPRQYFLLTAHREENVDSKEHLLNILKGLKIISDSHPYPIIFPIHPRTKKRITEFGLQSELAAISSLKVIEPLGFIDMIYLESQALLTLTDSGGIQEESCILNVPCVVLRKTSDRKESLDCGAAFLAWTDPDLIAEGVKTMLSRPRQWTHPFGDGKAAAKIVDHLLRACR